MSNPLLDNATLRNVKGFFSEEFRDDLSRMAQQFNVSEEEVMRERLVSSLTGSPVRYSLRKTSLHLAVDNTQ